MSKEYIENILCELAKITNNIVAMSKIKDSLGKTTNKNGLLEILKETRLQVDGLFDQSTIIKELFYEKYDEVLKDLETNSSSAAADESETPDHVGEESAATKSEKPMIKLVDINKLVEPKIEPKKSIMKTTAVRGKKIVQFDSTIIISSSEDEIEELIVRTKKYKTRNTKPSPKCKKPGYINNTIKKRASKISIIASSDSSDSDNEAISNLKKNMSTKNTTNLLNKKCVIEDVKLRSKCFVNLERVPYEKLSKLIDKRTKKLSSITRSRNLKKVSGRIIETDNNSSSETESAKKKHNGSDNLDSDSDNASNYSDKDEITNLPTLAISNQDEDKVAETVLIFSSSDHEEILEETHNAIEKQGEEELQINTNIETEPDYSKKSQNSLEDKESKLDQNKESVNMDENLSEGAMVEENDKDKNDDASNQKISDIENNSDSDNSKKNKNKNFGNKQHESDKSDKVIGSQKKQKGNQKAKASSRKSDSDLEDSSTQNLDKKNSDIEKTLSDMEDSTSKNKNNTIEIASIDNNSEKELNEDSNNEGMLESSVGGKKSSKKKLNKRTVASSDKSDSDFEDLTTQKNLDKDNYHFNKTPSDVEDSTLKNNKDPLDTIEKSNSNDDSEKKINEESDDDMLESSVDENESNKIKSSKSKKRKFRKRKKAILSDSDFDKNSSDDGNKESESDFSEDEKENEMEKVNKPARKRVKRVKDSSDSDGGDKSTRKQIRQVIGRDSLAETTKQAEATERERKVRIAEKQRKYNQVYEKDVQLNATVDKVILDFDEKTNKPLLKVHDDIVKKLKPHQASGIQFMWYACFESLELAKKGKGSGCIVAHCMGLGKTLQVIALSHSLLMHWDETGVNRVLVVTPVNTILNWKQEYKKWQPRTEQVDVYELTQSKQNFQRKNICEQWYNGGGVLIIGYNMFRTLTNPKNSRVSKNIRNSFQKCLVDPGPDLVVCDEGHLLKNEKTNLSIAMNRIRTLRRIVLTGTPLQNNLKEYFCMVQFIKPNLLGTYKEYLNRFVNPITNGQYTDSTQHDIQIMRKRSHVLHTLLDGIVQRRDYAVLQPYLPPKHEYVLFLNLSEKQIRLYEHYMNHYARKSNDGSSKTSFLFTDFQQLQRICTHPRVLLDKSRERQEKDLNSDEDSEGSLKDFIDDGGDTTPASSNSSDKSGNDSDVSIKSDESKKLKGRKTRRTRATARANSSDSDEKPVIELVQKQWFQEFCDGVEMDDIQHSSKIFLLFQILKECEQMGDKLLVFSQSLYSLNVIEYFLDLVHNATENDNTDSVHGFSGSWMLGLDYFRLDGSSSCDNRSMWCDSFNSVANPRARLFLISTRAGGLGINLCAANRVIIFDVSWNPSHDVQSIYRVYRFGQTKPSYIYRFVTYGTMEMKIYERQVTKLAISKRVIDEQQIDRHYNQHDLQELYNFEPNPPQRPTPLVPKDILLGEMLQNFENKIYKYHEHQSLLENKEEECLNEDERKAAWDEFENEKKAKPQLMYGNVGMQLSPANIQLALLRLVKIDNPMATDALVQTLITAYSMQLTEQISKGDFTLYSRVAREIEKIQIMQNQAMKNQYYQQQQMQALRLLQQRNMQNFANNHHNAGSSSTNSRLMNSTDIIELND